MISNNKVFNLNNINHLGEEDFSVVEQIASVDGYLNSSLTVAASYFNLDWLTVKRRLYNERYTGPTFRVKPGDLFDLKLVSYSKKNVI